MQEQSRLSFFLSVFLPSTPLIRCLPLSVHLSSLCPLICAPGCSTASHPAPCHPGRAEAARICPRTSSIPASCLWTDGTAKRGGENIFLVVQSCFFAFTENVCHAETDTCSLRQEGLHRQVAPAGHGRTHKLHSTRSDFQL